MKKRTVAILVFEGVELLDFAGPYEVFSAVRTELGGERLMEVFTVAETAVSLRCRNGLMVTPDYTLANCPPFDILLVPGGRGTRTAVHRADLIDWIAARSRETELTTSVCTGTFLLAQAGLLAKTAVTTHWGSIERLRADFPALEVRQEVRWVDAGKIVSSAGVSAGIDMAFHLVARLYGDEIAAETARWIEYDYWPPDGRVP